MRGELGVSGFVVSLLLFHVLVFCVLVLLLRVEPPFFASCSCRRCM